MVRYSLIIDIFLCDRFDLSLIHIYKIDSINENSKKQNEILSGNLIKQMNERFDRKDVYKRQVINHFSAVQLFYYTALNILLQQYDTFCYKLMSKIVMFNKMKSKFHHLYFINKRIISKLIYLCCVFCTLDYLIYKM